MGDADSARSLMNLVMQFRKVIDLRSKSTPLNACQVCNHPELFERADVTAPFSFCEFGKSGPLMKEADFVILPYSSRNPIQYSIPLLLSSDGGSMNIATTSLDHSSVLTKLMNIWSTDWIHQSLYHDGKFLTFLIPEGFYSVCRFFILFRVFALPGFTNFRSAPNTCLSCDATASHCTGKRNFSRKYSHIVSDYI